MSKKEADPLLGDQAMAGHHYQAMGRPHGLVTNPWPDPLLDTKMSFSMSEFKALMRLRQEPRGEIGFGLPTSLSIPCSHQTHNSSSPIITHSTRELLLHYRTNPKLHYGLLLIMSVLVSLCLRYRMSTN